MTEKTKYVVKLDDDQYYVDTTFVQNSQGGILHSELKHVGMGDFALKTPHGNIYFDRRDSLKFDGFVGRTHLMSSSADGLAKKLIVALGYDVRDDKY